MRKSKLVPITLRVPEEVRDGLGRLEIAFNLKRPAIISLLVREKLAHVEGEDLRREVGELRERIQALEAGRPAAPTAAFVAPEEGEQP